MSAEKCNGTNRQGNPCENWPVRGATVCRMHGGKAPQVVRAAGARAARLAAHAAAERMVARAGVDVDPIEHLLESLHRAAALVEVWGTMVAAIDAHAEDQAQGNGGMRGQLGYYELNADDRDELGVVSYDPLLTLNRHGEAQIHPYVAEYNAALDRRAKYAKLCIDAGVAQAQVELQERQVQLAARAFEAMLDDLELEPEKRQEARQTYARHLRLVA
jgi:hypothetical protein